MEKIASVQAPVKTAGKAQTAQMLPVQGAEPKDDFLKLLGEKKASADQMKASENAKTEAAEQPAEGKVEEETDLVKPEQPKDDGLEEALNQVLAEQAAALVAAVVTEDQTATEVQAAAAEVNVAEAVAAPAADVSEVQAEAPDHLAKAEAPVVRQKAAAEQTAKETAKPEVSKEQEADSRVSAAEVSKEQTAAPKDTVSPEGSLEEEKPQATVRDSSLEEPAKEVSKEEVSMNAYSMQNQGVAEQPTQMHQVQPKGEEVPMKATAEELPQELAKAVGSGRLAEGKVLTVELEPASLGKLTIRLVYEAGRAAVSIMASNPRTLDLLNEKAPELAQILKERTGEETVTYTQEAEQQQPEERYDGHRGEGQNRQDERQERREEEAVQADSFAQQLRLGLVV